MVGDPVRGPITVKLMKKLTNEEERSLRASAKSADAVGVLEVRHLDPDDEQRHGDREEPVAEGEHAAELGAVPRVETLSSG